MRGATFLLLLLPAILPPPVAQEPPPIVPQGLDEGAQSPAPGAEPILRKFRETHVSPLEEGLGSFKARADLTDLRDGSPSLEILLEWKGPGKESLSVVESARGSGRGRKAGADPGKKKKDWRTNFLRGLGDDMAGAALKAFLSRGDKIQAGTGREGGGGPNKPFLRVLKGKRSLGTAFFDPATGLLERLSGRSGDTYFTYTKIGGRWAFSSTVHMRNGAQRRMEDLKKKGKGNRRRTFRFSAYRKVNGYFLPAKVTLADARGPMEIDLEYILVNGKPALADVADPREAARRIKEFEKGWRKWNPLDKVNAVRDMERLGGPKVALALARKLNARSSMVREEIARALGNLKERAAVPYLARALEASRKNPAFFALLCAALGKIGDPRAVKALSKKLLTGNTRTPEWRILAQARVNAIGRIRSPESVDELIKLLSMAGGGGRRATRGGGKGPIYKFVRNALTRLTGEKFKYAFQWRKWWKAHRTGFFKKKKKRK